MKCLVLLVCLGRLSHCQDSSTPNNDYYQELNEEDISEIAAYEYKDDISDPYDIPILSDNVVRTEPFQQQEVLPLLSTNIIDNNDQVDGDDSLAETVIDPEVTDPEDMCRVSTGESNIVMDIPESLGNDYGQSTNPRKLPILGQVGRDINLDLVYPSGYSIFRLQDKVLHLTEPLDRDQSDLSSIVFQVNFSDGNHITSCLKVSLYLFFLGLGPYCPKTLLRLSIGIVNTESKLISHIECLSIKSLI